MKVMSQIIGMPPPNDFFQNIASRSAVPTPPPIPVKEHSNFFDSIVNRGSKPERQEVAAQPLMADWLRAAVRSPDAFPSAAEESPRTISLFGGQAQGLAR